jgi:Sec-independent protein translocase protein TatA
MFNIGIIELLIIVFFIVLFVKPKDLPLIIKNVGLFFRKIEKYFSNLKYEISDIETSIENADQKIRTKKNEVHRPLKRIKKKDTS